MLSAESVESGTPGRQEGRVPDNGRLLQQRGPKTGGAQTAPGRRRHFHVRNPRRKLRGAVRHGLRRQTRTRLHT